MPRAPAASGPHPRVRRPLGGLLSLAVVVVLLPVACSGEVTGTAAPAAAPATAEGDLVLATPPPLQPEDLVDLTVYYRAGEGSAAHLEPVVAEVPVSEDLPRRALELLLEGPGEEHAMLEAPLPTTTRVLGLAIEGGTAHVELTDEVVDDAASVGPSPANEALALAALANTLTEFPSVERVVVTVVGEDETTARGFWGGWGLPEVLVRDESLVGAGEGEGVVDLGRFSEETQTAGSPGSPPVRVTGVRVRDRITHTRVVVELADAVDPDAAAKVPPAKARRIADGITLVLADTAAADVEEGEVVDDGVEPALEIRSELDTVSGRFRLVLQPAEPHAYWLHTMSNPTRVVLDLKK